MDQKINFQKELDKVLENIRESSKTPSLLLHSCCGPCSSYVLDYLKDYFRITVFFYNPNMISAKDPDIMNIINSCNQYNIPLATNIASAEALILCLARGDLDWREQFRKRT